MTWGDLNVDDIVRAITALASAVAAIGTFINGRRITGVSSSLDEHVKKVDDRFRDKQKEVDIIEPIHHDEDIKTFK